MISREISNNCGGTFIAQPKVKVCERRAAAGVRSSFVSRRFDMKVKELMTPEAKAIWLTESLADAAKLMWDNDCGA